MVSIISLVQARMSSSRLPGKVLMPLGSVPVLEHVIRACEQFSQQVVICTSNDPSDDPIESFCQERQTLCIRGDLSNVFMRFRQALADPRVSQTDFFARVTADSPMLSVTLARQLIKQLDGTVDYARTTPHSVPIGCALELVRRASFEGIDPSTLDLPEQEHVTLRLYEEKGRYNCIQVEPPEHLAAPQFRLTLDYAEDYQLLQHVAGMSTEEAISVLQRKPEWAAINAHCNQMAAR